MQPRGEISRNVLLNDVPGLADLQSNKLKVIRSGPAQMDATILTHMLDPTGRPVSYLLAGKNATAFSNGEIVAVNKSLLDKTINIELLKKGEVYPPILHFNAVTQQRTHTRAGNESSGYQKRHMGL